MSHAMKMEVMNESGAAGVRFTIDGRSSLLTTGDVDTLIAALLRARADMHPPHPAKPLAARDYPLQFDPCWQVETSPLFEGPVLMLRHAGSGWIAYMLPPASVARLVEVLQPKAPHAAPVAMLMN